MKTLLENWKRFVKEARDAPVIPRTLHSYERGPSVQDRIKKAPSVSYKQVQQPEFVESVKTLFNKTEDKWVIIVLDDAHAIQEEVNKEYFKEWLDSKKDVYPSNAKILIVGSYPYADDSTSPEWIVHDILGHTVGKLFLNEKNKFYSRVENGMIVTVHNYLANNKRPVSKADMVFDMLYDIFASIILKDLTREDIQKMPNLSKQQIKILNEIFTFADNWVASIPADNTKVTVLELF
jgi:hypothetical protein